MEMINNKKMYYYCAVLLNVLVMWLQCLFAEWGEIYTILWPQVETITSGIQSCIVRQ